MSKPAEVTSTVGQEVDALIAEHVMGHEVIRQKKGGIKERTVLGTIRPLRAYSRDMNAAWEVAQKLRVTLIPIDDKKWFALVGREGGWTSPAELMQYMADNSFASGGAAVQDTGPLAICLAALTAVEKRRASKKKTSHLKAAEAPSEDATLIH